MALDNDLVRFEAKLLWQADGLAITVLKYLGGFHDRRYGIDTDNIYAYSGRC